VWHTNKRLALKAREKGGRHNDTTDRKTQPTRVSTLFGLVPRPWEAALDENHQSLIIIHPLRAVLTFCAFVCVLFFGFLFAFFALFCGYLVFGFNSVPLCEP
jgi:hypothetical protein